MFHWGPFLTVDMGGYVGDCGHVHAIGRTAEELMLLSLTSHLQGQPGENVVQLLQSIVRHQSRLVVILLIMHHAGRLAAPLEHVEVAGLLLPRREDSYSSGSSSIATTHRLVRTPAVERTLQAAALAVCQQQPLLLQGPPGR